MAHIAVQGRRAAQAGAARRARPDRRRPALVVARRHPRRQAEGARHQRVQAHRELPDVPTVRELGYPSLEFEGWNGFFAPAKTPRAVIERLHKKTAAAVRHPDVQKRLQRPRRRAGGLLAEEQDGDPAAADGAVPSRDPGDEARLAGLHAARGEELHEDRRRRAVGLLPFLRRHDVHVLVLREQLVQFRVGQQARERAADLDRVGAVVARNDAGRNPDRLQLGSRSRRAPACRRRA